MALSTVNNTTNTSTKECNPLLCVFSNEERYVIIASLFIVATISLIGNVLVCCAFICGKGKGSLTLSSFHLAISDLLISVFCTPIVATYLYILGEWTFGPVMCKLVNFVQTTGVVASLLNLLLITVEKYLAVCYPFYFRVKRRRVHRYSLAFVWLLAMADSAFHVQFKRQKNFGGTNYCMEHWPSAETRRNVKLTQALFFFITLLAIIVLLCFTIYGLRFGHGHFRHAANREEDHSSRRKRTRQKRAIKILVVTMLSVLVCWTPLQGLSLLSAVGSDIDTRVIHIVFAVSVTLFFAGCSIHPIIYLFITQRGRELVQTSLASLSSTRESRARRRRTSSALEGPRTLVSSTSSRKCSVTVLPNRPIRRESEL